MKQVATCQLGEGEIKMGLFKMAGFTSLPLKLVAVGPTNTYLKKVNDMTLSLISIDTEIKK